MSVRQVSIPSEPDSSYFLRLDWRGRDLGAGFQLLLTDGQNAWRGEVSAAEVCSEAEELEMQTERYVQDLQQALAEVSGDTAAYTFSLTPSPPDGASALALAYEKVQRDIAFRLGSVTLEAVTEPADAVRQLLVHSLQRGNTLEQHNQRLEEENLKLSQEQQRIASELKRYAGCKEALEAELYSRFVLVLNEKKAKIRSLQQSISSLQQTSRESDERGNGDTAQSERAAGPDEDEYGGSTDEEPESAQPTPAEPQPESPAGSPLDDSLRDITDVAPCRKRRFRHLGAPDAAAKKPNPPTSHRKRSDPPAGSSKRQTPQRSADAAAATSEAEDLFEDF